MRPPTILRLFFKVVFKVVRNKFDGIPKKTVWDHRLRNTALVSFTTESNYLSHVYL